MKPAVAAPDTLADWRGRIHQGDCVTVMNALPAGSVDLVFADPPYNLQLRKDLHRPDQTRVMGVDEDWDRFASPAEYDQFTRDWLTAARRVLKPGGALWVIGSYHNIYRIGAVLAELGFWILNDVIWSKPNAMPNFRGTRLQNQTEILLWASLGPTAKYTFNYQALKSFNDDKQLGNVWEIPICSGGERLKADDGDTLHSTQKPEALLYRVLLSSSNAGDVVLDPFFGTGTTGAAAKRLGRDFIGIDRDPAYIDAATKRIAAVTPVSADLLTMPSKRTQKKIPFGTLVANNMIPPGSVLTSARGSAIVQADASLIAQHDGELRGSIHKLGAVLQNAAACNGWDYWFYNGAPIDAVRQRYLKDMEQISLKELDHD